jgi:tetratricopeptide (TPR) repeat protein
MSDIQSSLVEVQNALAKENFPLAEAMISELEKENSNDPDIGYFACLLLRLQGNFAEASQKLSELTTNFSDHAKALQETVIVNLALNNPSKAHNAAERAVAIDPSLLQCWQYLIPLRQTFDPSKAEAAARQVAFLGALPTELRTVISYLSHNKLQDAERLAKYFLRDNKTHPEGMRLLAEVLTRKNILDEAQFVLETLVELNPDLTLARLQLFHVLMRRQRFHAAFDMADSLRRNFPNDKDEILRAYAAAAFAVGRVQEAKELYKRLAQIFPQDHVIPINQGHIYNSTGERDRAIECFKRSITLQPSHGDSYWSLANTKSYRFSENEVSNMQTLESSGGVGSLDRIQICFALGKAYEDAKDYDSAYTFYDRGNELKLPLTHYDPNQLHKRVQAQIDVCSAEFFSIRQEVGCTTHDPIFIVGLPRAGSTLLEQILASHSKVDGTMELHNILDLAKRLRGRDADRNEIPRYPRIMADLEFSLYRQFGEQFIEQTKVYRGKAPMFIDKMPNNFFHIGLIKLILPNAKVIDARRHPMACCFSGFKQLFGEGQEFSYGLHQIGDYYREYVRLMNHWDEVLPGFVLRVQHEDVIDDLETQVRRILDFCGLEFEESCVEFHKTKRTVRTPSAEQVRQPINTSGVDQWRNFEEYLDPLKQALGPELLDTYKIDPPR